MSGVDVRREGTLKGAYVAKPEVGELKKIVMGAGSEVQHLMAAFKDDAGVTVVSMLFMGRFDRQDSTYRKEVLPKSCTDRTAMEAVVSGLWHKYTGLDGKVVGVDKFGFSAPGDIVMKEFGMTAENIKKVVG